MMVILCLVMALLLAGCSQPGGNRADSNAVRPPEAQATLSSGGSQEAARMRPYTPPPEFPLQFTIRLPEGFVAAVGPEGPAQAIHVTQPTTDSKGDRAFLHFVVAAPDQHEGGARETVRAIAESYGVPGNRTEVQPIEQHTWALVEFGFTSRGTIREPVTGWVALGCQAGRWFHIIVQSPVGAPGESFRAGAEQVLAEWRWPDGRSLDEAGEASLQGCRR